MYKCCKSMMNHNSKSFDNFFRKNNFLPSDVASKNNLHDANEKTNKRGMYFIFAFKRGKSN